MSLLNTMISLPISRTFQRAEAESFIKSRMHNKQYRPSGVPKSSLPFNLPFPKPNHPWRTRSTQKKKVARKVSHISISATTPLKPSCEPHPHTPVFWWCSVVFTVFSRAFHAFSRMFHASKWTKKVPHMIYRQFFQILLFATSADLLADSISSLILAFHPFFIFLPKLHWDWANTVSPLAGRETIVASITPQLNVKENG
jgi:hypothetical protein